MAHRPPRFSPPTKRCLPLLLPHSAQDDKKTRGKGRMRGAGLNPGGFCSQFSTPPKPSSSSSRASTLERPMCAHPFRLHRQLAPLQTHSGTTPPRDRPSGRGDSRREADPVPSVGRIAPHPNVHLARPRPRSDLLWRSLGASQPPTGRATSRLRSRPSQDEQRKQTGAPLELQPSSTGNFIIPQGRCPLRWWRVRKKAGSIGPQPPLLTTLEATQGLISSQPLTDAISGR